MSRSREMNNEKTNQQKRPTVIAKLMGLDDFPVQQSASSAGNIRSKNNIDVVYTVGKTIHEPHLHENICSGRMARFNSGNLNSRSNRKIELKDVREVQNPSSKSNRSIPLPMGIVHGDPHDKRMALVHKKFTEAKRLVKSENLLQSKEFQEALEVLSSNRDLFLKFFEEPNPLFSKYLREVQPSSRTDSECITMRKPSKLITEHVQEQRKINDTHIEANELKKLNHRSDNVSHSTRIVVLKPDLGKSCDWKDDVSDPSPSERFPETDDAYCQSGENELRLSRKGAMEITHKMQERLESFRKDEILLPPVQPNRYGDGKVSSTRSLNECMEEERGDISSQMKTTLQSWEYQDRRVNPCSLSSISKASYSSESAVVREAKKHLSERWVMVVRNGVNQKYSRICSSNTLGKMLAVPEVEGEESHETPTVFCGRTRTGEHELRRKDVANGDASAIKSVWRLGSVRASEVKISDIQDGRSVSKHGSTQTTSKSPFKEKISNLFSSRNKEIITNHPASAKALDTGAKKGTDLTQCAGCEGPQFHYEAILKNNLQNPELNYLGPGSSVGKDALTLEMKLTSENTMENMEQPSPISVLESAFEEEESNCSYAVSSKETNPECRFVSKVPSIESIVRSLSWDEDNLVETYNMKGLYNSLNDVEEEEWSAFVRTLLTSSGLSNETSASLTARLHPLNGLLDQAVLERYIEPKREGAKSRQRRSNQRLIFDAVNFALLEIIDDERSHSHKMLSPCRKKPGEKLRPTSLTEKVLTHLREWFSVDSEGTFEQGESRCLMTDTAIRSQVVGMEWQGIMKSEIVEMGGEIEKHVMDELVGEVLDGFIPRLL